MLTMARLAFLMTATLLLGCSSNGSKGGDAGDAGNAGDVGNSGDVGNGGDVGTPGDGNDPCNRPLSETTACEISFAMQVSNNPCDSATATQAMCGKYQVWTMVLVGGQTCIYDTSNHGALVGARTCGGATAECAGGCTNFGIAPSQYATCGPETDACPP